MWRSVGKEVDFAGEWNSFLRRSGMQFYRQSFGRVTFSGGIRWAVGKDVLCWSYQRINLIPLRKLWFRAVIGGSPSPAPFSWRLNNPWKLYRRKDCKHDFLASFQCPRGVPVVLAYYLKEKQSKFVNFCLYVEQKNNIIVLKDNSFFWFHRNISGDIIVKIILKQ